MKSRLSRILIAGAVGFGLLLGSAQSFAATTLNGAGATFPFPIYSKWFDEYHKLHSDIQINYQSIGSGGGIRQIQKGTVDFGATDGPMTDKEMWEAKKKVLHIPTVLGAVVPAFNIKGIKNLNFSGPVLADIFLGKITNWNDTQIQELNSGVKLPDASITVVHRSDGSGTTYTFVDYLSKVSREWKEKVGVGKSVKWPMGLGGKGNEGVAGLVQQAQNSIGYVELIYAIQTGLPFGKVQNMDGQFVEASVETTSAAAAGVEMPKDFRVSITNARGKNSYPISTFTWLLVYEKNPNEKGKIIKDFLTWMIKDGQGYAGGLGYAPLPTSVRVMIEQTLKRIN